MIIRPFDPGSESETAFVFNAVRKRAYDWPWSVSDTNHLIDLARRNIVSNPRGCLLAIHPTDPTIYYGYVLTDVGTVTMAYTKDALRGPGAFDAPVGTPYSHEPVCTTLLERAGITLVNPTPVRIWSRAASKIAARGYKIHPIPT